MTSPSTTTPRARRAVRAVLLAFPLAVALVAAVPEPAAADVVRVSARAANVRSGPGSRYRLLASARRGQELRVVDRSGNWVKVKVGSKTGWIHGSLLGPAGGGAARRDGGAAAERRRGGSLVEGLGGLAAPARDGEGSAPADDDAGDERDGDAGPADDRDRDDDAVAPQPAAEPVSVGRRSRAGFIQLPNSGPGYFGYYSASRRWGKPELVYGIQRVARAFAGRGYPRVGIGDISFQNGGKISGHASHRRGVDVDVRPIRNDGREGPVTIQQRAYSHAGTKVLIGLFRRELRCTNIFFNDRRVPGTSRWPNHDNHFHVRIAG